MNRGWWTILIVSILCCVVVIGCNGGDDELAGDDIPVSEPTNNPSSASPPSSPAPAQPAPDTLAVPTLQSPANGSSVFMGEVEIYDWSDVSGATSYVFVLHSPSMNGSVLEIAVPASGGSWEPYALDELGEWEWGVQALGPNGASDVSAMWIVNAVIKPVVWW